MSDWKRKLAHAVLNPVGFIHGMIPGRAGQALTNPMGFFHSFAPGTQGDPNRTRWAKITDKAGANPTRYGWEEQTFQQLDPGQELTIGFVKADAGIEATTELNPVIEPNNRNLDVGEYVLVQPAYYDPVYDIVYITVNSGAGAGGLEFIRVNANDPDSSGRYDATLMGRQPDGTLYATATSVWLREAQNQGRFFETGIYQASITGFAAGRPVYTVADFIQAVGNATLSQIVPFVHLWFFAPNRTWDITLAGVRQVRVERILNVRETSGTVYDQIYQVTFDPATNWEVDDDDDDGDVIIRRVLNIREGTTSRTTFTWQIDFDDTDFDVAATAAGHATINTNGLTGTRNDYRYCCITGTLYEVSVTIQITRGLVKVWGSTTCV